MMADHHRSVAGYKQTIAADTSSLVQNFNKKSPEYTHGYRQTNVYEQYARPKSRRSSVPMERPKTSRSRRPNNEGNINTTVTERPVSRHGRNSTVEGITRPVTRHGRNSVASENIPERPVTRHGRQSQQEPERPKTRHGRRASEYDETPAQDTSERDSHEPNILILDNGFQSEPPKPPIRARPKSAKGRVRPRPAPRAPLDRDEMETPLSITSPTPSYIVNSSPQPQMVTPIPRAASDSRPSSSLNRFTPLPSIGRRTSVENDITRGNYSNVSPRQASNSNPSVSKVANGTHSNNIADRDKIKQTNGENSDSFNHLRSQLQRLNTRENLLSKGEKGEKPTPKPRNKSLNTKPENVKSQGKTTDTVISTAENESSSEFEPLKRKVVLPAEPNENEEHFILAVKLPSGQRSQRRFRPNDSMQTVINFAEVTAKLDFTGCELVCDVPTHVVIRDLKMLIKNSGLENRTVLHVQVPDEE